MELYQAEIRHSAETVKRFTLLQYNTFEWWRKLLFLVLSAVLILFGLVSKPDSASPVLNIFCIFAGCFLFTSLNSRANGIADSVIEAMHGQFPVLQYSFSDSGFTDGEERPFVPYGKLFRLIEDEEYLYLFVSKASGYMIEKKSVKGPEDLPGLMELLSSRTGLGWQKPFSLMTFRLKDIFASSRKK
jgi:hypothetical protein